MSDLADKPSVQSPIAPLAERQVVQFISDALRAGQRAILITGCGQVSIRVPEAALAACVSTSARVLHIGPPLPQPLELSVFGGGWSGVLGEAGAVSGSDWGALPDEASNSRNV